MRLIKRFDRISYAYASLAAMFLLGIVDAIADPALIKPSDWATTLGTMFPFIVVSMAQAPAVMSGGGGVDLSVGPVAGFVNVFVVGVLAAHSLDSPFLVVPAALLVGAGIGLLNGLLVTVARIPAIVATLGTYLMVGALAIDVLSSPGGHAPQWLVDIDSGVVGPVPGTLFVLIGIGVAWMALQRTAFRRNLLAVGGDARSAFASGVNVTLIRTIAYMLSGVLAAVAGLGFAAVLESGDPTIGPPYTLISLTGAALGGVTLAGGRGGLLGAAAGGAILFLVQNTLGLLHVSTFYTQIAYGAVLLAALAVNGLADHRRRHSRRGERSESLGAAGATALPEPS
ncbi:MAG: ABC transporter permease [Actinobacteria bacterium]|nr:ABC transporter permease [Actinomycetota bacterium]